MAAVSTFIIFFLIAHLALFSVSVKGKLIAEIKQNQNDNGPYVGVNIGTDVSNFLSPTDLVTFLQFQKITHVRLYDADPDTLKALARTKIRVIIGVPNNQLIAIGSSNDTAATWIKRNVVAHYPHTLIIAISVGDEVLTTIPSVALLLLPAIQSLYSALVAAKLHNVIKVSTPHSASLILDPNTLLHYTNVYDAMIDSAYFSMKNLNVTDVMVLVTETGWPSKGDPKEPHATLDNADTYNSNLLKHVFDRSGTPFHPEFTSNVYIYELFNEDLRSPPISEGNWGLFYGNTTPVYLLHVSGSGTFLANDSTNQTFCIAMDGVDTRTLQTALDWACGPGKANCSEIQHGESCYQPNNVKSHASYAFDSYYQNEGKAPGSCDFKGAATITTSDPSHGNCIFPGSKKLNDSAKASSNTTQSSGAISIRQFTQISSKINFCILVVSIVSIIPSIVFSK